MIKVFPIETNISKSSTYNEFLNFYKKNTYKNVFIDFDEEDGKRLNEEITKINPNQKLILLNENFSFVSEKACELCQENFQKQIILKPINQELLSKIINDKMHCELKNRDYFSFTMEKINRSIYKKFPYLNYTFNKEYTDFTSEKLSAQMVIYIADLFQKNNIKFDILDYDRIKIYKN